MAEKVTVVYDGPNAAHAAVDVHDPVSGSLVAQNVERGQSIEVDKYVGESLVESGNFISAKQKPASDAAQKEGK